MSTNSRIEWTETTWNPVTGCNHMSPGCLNCYAERMSKRLQAMGSPSYVNGFEPTMHERLLELPYSWKKPRKVFVNSMSDLFHNKVTTEFIEKVFETMNNASAHQFQILTKRPARVIKLNSKLRWADNIWMGVSVELAELKFRIDRLRETAAHIKFLSLEPLLGSLGKLNLKGIDWVIVGGESGPGARPMDPKWVIEIRDQCIKARVAFFFKQWGGVQKKKAGRILEGRTWDEMPA
ncbi:MAG: phage Gp37/Gp68 family protein [candidate division Zixibacteria bacterium]|nr:phage Gp37/Gp68 family protein [candidate division Zixibacteria bacterium]